MVLTMSRDALMKAVQKLGSQRALAVEIGASQQNISCWLRSKLPAERVICVEKATGVPRSELRPDLFKTE